MTPHASCMSRRRVLLTALVLLSTLAVALARRKKEEPQATDDEVIDYPHVHPLVAFIGKEMYGFINTRKYKFYFYIVLGSLPDEQSTIALLSTLCNVLYGTLVWFGFVFLPRDRMLLVTILTLYVGPAMILILIGAVAAAMVAFAVYPVYSVLAIWVWFFLTSQVAQALGMYLGLDHDGDGDVDALDFLHWMASTSWGRAIGLEGLYKMLRRLERDPFQEINRRLDRILDRVSDDEQAYIKQEDDSPPPIKERLRKRS